MPASNHLYALHLTIHVTLLTAPHRPHDAAVRLQAGTITHFFLSITALAVVLPDAGCVTSP